MFIAQFVGICISLLMFKAFFSFCYQEFDYIVPSNYFPAWILLSCWIYGSYFWPSTEYRYKLVIQIYDFNYVNCIFITYSNINLWIIMFYPQTIWSHSAL